MAGNMKDFATGIVVVAPSPADSGTSLELDTGQGARMPATPFFATAHPPTEMPTLDNAEKVQVTDVTGDVLTIVRAQGDTDAQDIEAGWRLSNTLFLENIPDELSELNGDMDDIDDGSTYVKTENNYTDAEVTKLAGIEAAADVTDAGNVGSSIHGASGKTTPVDADTVPLIDSAASNVLKKVTWANIKATLKTYFDTLYQPIDATLTALAGLATGANKIPYSTGTDTFGQLDLSTNTSLGTSDTTLSTQKAVKAYVDGKAPTANSTALFTDEGTSSTSYVDLATVISTTVTVGPSGVLLVYWSGGAYNTAGIAKMSVALSGSNTVAANDDWSTDTRNISYLYGQSCVKVFSGLTPGSTTVTMKFKTSSGTANFFNKSLGAIAL